MSEEEKAKHHASESVFYDDEYGYESNINTLKHARQINTNVTMDDINRFMTKVSFRNKKGYSNYN